MARGFGGAIKLTGESEYRRALSQITQSLKVVSSEMKAASTSFDAGGKSSEELADDSEKLKTALDKQKAALGPLKSKLAAMAEEYEKTGAKHKALTEKYEDEKTKLDAIGRELGESSDEYKQQKTVVEQLSQEVADSAKQYDSQGKALNNMKIKTANAETAANRAAQSLDDLGDKAQGSGEKAKSAGNGGFTVLKGALANLAGNIISSAVDGIKGLASDAISASDSLKKFESTMKFAGYDGATIKKAKADMKDYADKTVYDLDTVANTTAQLAANGVKDYTGLTQAAGNLNAVAGGNADTFQSVAMVLTQTAGAGKLTTENWNQLSDAIPGASGKIQEALQKNGAYTGNFRDAMEKGQITADEFNKAIMDLGYTDAAKKAATSTDTFEGAMGNMQAAVTDGLMQIYDAIGSENVTGFINGISDAVSEVIPPIKSAVSWFKKNLPTLKPMIAGIAASLGTIMVAQKIEAVVTAFNKWKKATEGLTAAQKVLNAVQLSSPIGLVIGLIAGVVAAIVVLWNTNKDFRDAVLDIWGKIKDFIGNAISAIGNFFTNDVPNAIQAMLQFFQDLPSNIAGFLGDAISAVGDWASNLAGKAADAGSNFVQNVVNFVQNLPYNLGYMLGTAIGTVVTWAGQFASNAAKAGSEFVRNVVNFVRNLPANIGNFLSNVISKVASWAGSMASHAGSAGSRFVSGVVRFVQQLPSRIGGFLSQVISRLASWAGQMAAKGADGARRMFDAVVNGIQGLPSKVGSIGKNIVQGLWNGIAGAGNWIKNKVGDFAKGILDGMKNALGIHSPSRVFRDQVGKYIAQGVGVGFTDEMKSVSAEMQDAIPTSFDLGTAQVGASTHGTAIQGGYYNVVEAFKQALSEMKIEMNDEEMGRFVDRTVTNLVYS